MDKYQQYDLAVARACANFNSLAMRSNGQIRLMGFDKKNPAHLCALRCADIAHQSFEEVHEVVIEDGFWSHLFAPKWVRAHKRKKHFNNGIDLDTFISFTLTGLDVSFAEIYKEYYE